FLDVDESLAYEQVPQDLEVLHRDCVAVVVVGDRLGRGDDAFALRDGLDDRRAQAPHGRRALDRPVAQLVQRARRGAPRRVLPGAAVRARVAAADAEHRPDGADDRADAETARDAAAGGARAAARALAERARDDLVDVAVALEERVELLAKVDGLRSRRRLPPLPVDDGDLLLLP